MNLSIEQQTAFDAYKMGQNVFITGPGGSGKSMLIRKIVNDAKENDVNVQVCAMTGTAAVILQCGAKTVHSWGGIGLANGDIKATANKVNKSKFKKRNWKTVDLLIIDEVSMMSQKIFELLEYTARLCRKNVQSFGGIQVIFTGDFYQLPPVGKVSEPETCNFCFESPLWNSVFTNQIQLVTIFRQEDTLYKKILNQIRIGKLTKSVVKRLKECVNREIDSDSKILPTILYPTRKSVDAINTKSLKNLTGEPKTFSFSEIDSKDLSLIVESFGDDGNPIVRFKNGAHRVITPHMWQSETIPSVGIKQIPLILAWAITIHKSQGATLDQAEIDIGNGIFECGQTYVALSRVKSLDGVYLRSFNPNKILINTKVRRFYENLNT
jgi:ATP-dependent DNA helicase PIF1